MVSIEADLPRAAHLNWEALAIELLKQSGAALQSSSDIAFWRDWEALREDPFDDVYPELEDFYGNEVVLSFLGRSHLGDVLCMTPLLRKLKEAYDCRVSIVRHRSTYKVLENNPYVSRFFNDNRISLAECARGPGHMIQKLERYFGLEVSFRPKPEVYLSPQESHWAWQIRSMLPRNRPIAIVSMNSVTDNRVASNRNFEWQRWIDALSQRFIVVQPALTRIEPLEEVVRMHESHRRVWMPDQILDNVFVMENLDTRKFMALFSIADLYVGPNSSGAHLAAAFDVPALVVLNRRQYRSRIRFPDRITDNHWRHESFLYPYHSFIWR